MIGLFELTEFFHDIFCVLLQVGKDLGLNLISLINVLHLTPNGLEFVVDLVLQYLALCFQGSQLHVDLLENVQFTVGLEDGLFQVFNFGVGFLLLLFQLINFVGIVDQFVNNRVNDFLH